MNQQIQSKFVILQNLKKINLGKIFKKLINQIKIFLLKKLKDKKNKFQLNLIALKKYFSKLKTAILEICILNLKIFYTKN